jgi:hypothetical protein
MGQDNPSKDGSVALPMGPTHRSGKTPLTMFSKVLVQSQAVYEAWAQKVLPLENEFSCTLLPIAHSFKGKGFCSQAVEVTI